MKTVLLILWLLFTGSSAYAAVDLPTGADANGLLAILVSVYVTVRDAIIWWRNYRVKGVK